MNGPWLQRYPDEVPAEIDVDAYASLAEMFAECVARYPDNPAFSNLGATLTFAELDRLSAAFGATLQHRLGLGRGDRIALMMPNLLQYPVALIGALRAGLTVVNTNPLYTARELEHQLSDSGARAIVILENFAHVLDECRERTALEHVIVTRMGDLLGFPKGMLVNFVVRYVKRLVPSYRLPGRIDFRSLLDGDPGTLETPALGHDDIAFLQYTGGTTGVAKGVMLTHRNMVANVLQASAWIGPFIQAGRELIVTALPLYHIFALTANCLTFMKAGGHNLLITNPRDMPGFVKLLGGVQFTAITGVNTLFNGLLNTPGFEALDFSRLRLSLGGGMAVQRAVAERWHQVTGCPLLEAYGLTETAPAVCMNPLDLEAYNGTIGLPISSTEVRVVDDQGKVLGIGEPGELCVRGPQVTPGYWQRPEETRACLDDDGWLHTGDVAAIDDTGFVSIVDRKKDMILVSGFNVYPNEIEDVIAAHPGVLEVGAIGVVSEESGESVKVVVVRRDAALTAEELRAYCRGQLTGYKRPKYIQFADELPKTNVGKILRRELRERFGDTSGD